MDGSQVIMKAQGDNCNMRDGGYDNTCGYMILAMLKEVRILEIFME